jgi:PadR family transcriptional regulator, regulatory protein PadR
LLQQSAGCTPSKQSRSNESITNYLQSVLPSRPYLLYYAVDMAKEFFLGEYEQIVLLAILRLEDSAYGVSIQAEISSCTGRKSTPGALYTTLERLERKGCIASRIGEPTKQRGGRAKCFYRLTKTGRAQLVSAQSAFTRLLSGLDLLGDTNG